MSIPTKANEPLISDKNFFSSCMMAAGFALWAWSVKKYISTPTIVSHTILKPYASYTRINYGHYVPEQGSDHFTVYERRLEKRTVYIDKFPDTDTATTCAFVSWLGTNLIMFGSHLQQQ